MLFASIVRRSPALSQIMSPPAAQRHGPAMVLCNGVSDADDIHREALATVPTVTLGRFFILTGFRKELNGMLEGTSPYPWNLNWT